MTNPMIEIVTMCVGSMVIAWGGGVKPCSVVSHTRMTSRIIYILGLSVNNNCVSGILKSI